VTTRITALAICSAALAGCGGHDARFSFQAPPGWRTTRAQSPVTFAAVAPAGRVRVTVVETHVPERLSFRQFARNEPKMLAAATAARGISVRDTALQGRRALRVTYVLGRERVTQYFVRTGELMNVVTYTSPLR
jgi:hypothetical protein